MFDGILKARSNPVRVHASGPERQVYWGDLHSHSRYGWDGVGGASFEYARHVSALDFYALTDHSLPGGAYTRGLGPHVWEEYNALTERHYEPGKFVTLHAYRASFGTPYGHHNVYLRGKPGPLVTPGGDVGLPELWKALTAGQALTVPHHTGKFPEGVRWDIHDAELRRNFEMYSAHGLSEAFDPQHPLAFEQSDFTGPSRSLNGPHFAQDAWAQGLLLSSIAASDDHRAQPGRPTGGWRRCTRRRCRATAFLTRSTNAAPTPRPGRASCWTFQSRVSRWATRQPSPLLASRPRHSRL